MAPRIIFGVLNWGLGHATRSVPLIQQLINEGFEVIIASDGAALDFLKATFPNLTAEALPAYNIRYSLGRHQTIKIAQQLPKIARAIFLEQRRTKQLVAKYRPQGLISDNRLGFWHADVPTVYISHQLRFRLILGSALANRLHAYYYQRFSEVWIPDFAPPHNLAGELSRVYLTHQKHQYLGPLSRFKPSQIQAITYQLLVVLSGPEPQRSLLENLVLQQANSFKGTIALVRGVFDGSPLPTEPIASVVVFDYLLSDELAEVIGKSQQILMRSGYSSIMDLYALQRGAVLIPTPGQPEQEYLAAVLQKNPSFFVVHQADLQLNLLPATLPAPKVHLKTPFNNLFQIFRINS